MLIYKKTLVKKSQICFNKYENISTLGKNRRKQAFFVVMQNNVGGKGLMLKRIFLAILLLFTSYVPAHSAEIVNVEYVHSLIKKVWDIDVPYYEDSLKYAANMEYVLKAVDKANEILNGTPTTDYGSSEYATLYAADTVATIDAVNRLIEKQNKSSFYITTTPDTSSFDIMISAAGEYTIDWGDGKTDTITKTDTTMTPYSHTYDKAGEYTIGLGGKATDYNDAEIDITQEGSEELMMMSAAISFAGNTNIANISGSLGEIFSTLPDGSQPRFAATFMMTSITSIPENLFSGVQGAPKDFMFAMTFVGTPITSIPENLFSGIQGAPANGMFYGTFGMTPITSIPDGLFDGISGAPAEMMFAVTFTGCTNLSGEIPLGLFGELSGAPAEMMFMMTFSECSGLTGPSARQPDGTYLYDYFDTATITQVDDMYKSATGLEDYPCIPELWGGAGGVCGGSTDPIEPVEPSFFITTTPDTSSFSFQISAAGEYTIDWGDGNIETITKSDTTETTYMHTYASAGEYTIGISGKATAYSSSSILTAAVSFSYNTNIAEISGSLGKVFSTLSDGTQPRFYSTFEGCSGLTGEIPADLFAGISGAPASYMFSNTFYGCSGLTSIPADLFAGISGAPASSMFSGTFYGCSGLTSIPEDLFAGIQGAPASSMFQHTFSRCSGLTGEIPADLFAGIKGAPADSMFSETFSGCSGLTSIPADLFAGIQGAPAIAMFYGTFSGCTNLTGSIPENLFSGITGAPASSMFNMTFSGCSGLTGSIPENLFAGIKGAPAESMFDRTFYGCSGLTGEIPADLFAGIQGAPAIAMFYGTFSGCTNLTGSIPAGLFAGITGAPAAYMFDRTFDGCSGLTGEIPLGLFGTFTSNTPQDSMFWNTFNGCSKLTGPSARQPDGTYLYDYFNTATTRHVSDMYRGATGLSDYASIPAAWK